MSHLDKCRDLMRRALAIRAKNPDFAARLFEEAKREYLLAKTA